MSDVLGTGAYGDPANPNQTREEYNAEHGITDDVFAPVEEDEAPAPTTPPASSKAPKVADNSPSDPPSDDATPPVSS